MLGSETQFKDWIELTRAVSAQAALHVETGINAWPRPLKGFAKLPKPRPLTNFNPLILSHPATRLADNPSNAEQLQRFTALEKFIRRPRSLAASYGIYLGKAYHFDMVRAGIAL